MDNEIALNDREFGAETPADDWEAINRGLKDCEEGRVKPYSEIKKMYGR